MFEGEWVRCVLYIIYIAAAGLMLLYLKTQADEGVVVLGELKEVHEQSFRCSCCCLPEAGLALLLTARPHF